MEIEVELALEHGGNFLNKESFPGGMKHHPHIYEVPSLPSESLSLVDEELMNDQLSNKLTTFPFDAAKTMLLLGIFLIVLCAFLARAVLSSRQQRLKSSSTARRKRPSRSQHPFRLNRANSSFADIYRELRSDSTSMGRTHDTTAAVGILGRLRSATTNLYWSSSGTRPQIPSSMDISDNIQNLYLDSDADRLDRQADESLFVRLLQKHSEMAPLNQTPETSRHTLLEYSLLGPTVTSVQFRTWIPPPSWAEASRNFIANRETFHHLARMLTWEFGAKPVLTETVSTKLKLKDRRRRAVESSIPISQVRLEVYRPPEMGVLYIHRNDSDQVQEHSFRSAQAAAQFQTDVTMLQACGRSIYCLFQALVIAQNGSLSSAVVEPIFNCEKGGEDNLEEHGVAWADVMQCLGNEMPCIRFRLDALVYMQGAREQESALLQPEYQRKRLLLGPIDFFRLFVPTLPESAVPISDSNRMRTEHVLRIRKRVACAAVLVQGFVTARCVANRGWQMADAIPRKRRMAFDDAIDNEQHDLKSQKEYYETNQKQGYILVGIHSLPWNGPVDPVLSFRSLRALVEDYPRLHFWIQSFYIESQEHLTVKVFVRSLPPEVDPSFDSAVKTFMNGDRIHRETHLQMGIQLGVIQEGLSLLGRFLLLLLSLVLRWEIGKAPRAGTSGTTLPTLNLIDIAAKTLHFGGCFCTNESLPSNYVACTAILGPQNKKLISRVLFLFVEMGIFSKIVSNITMNLLHCKRPLSAVRLVRDATVTATNLDIAHSLKTAYELVLMKKQYSEIPEIEDLQGSFGDCSLASYSADRYRYRDALGEAARRVLGQLERSPDLAFVLNDFRVEDVRRFLVDSNGKVKVAISRLALTALWRRKTFPIDIRQCRVELQSGQLFSYGEDCDGCPVIYFRNMCLGPWRKNVEATVAAILHRFDMTLSAFAQSDPNVRLTLIVLLGKPLNAEASRKAAHVEQDDMSAQGTADSTATPGTGSAPLTNKNKLEISWNPRVREDELWYPHTDHNVVQRLIEIARNHYPERFHRVLLVSGTGFRWARSSAGRKLAIRRALLDSKLRNRVVYISRYRDIQKFVEPSQIPDFCGGTAVKIVAHHSVK